MKRVVGTSLVVLFALVPIATVTAQDVPDLPGIAEVGENPANAVQLDLSYLLTGLLSGGFGIGGTYERALTDQISAKVLGGFVSWSLEFFSERYGFTFVDLYAEGRYYIWPTALNGLYVGGGAGVTFVSYTYADISGSSVWPGVFAQVGYKFTLGGDATGGFFIEPFVGFRGVFGTLDIAGIAVPSYGGARYGLGLGFAF